MTTTTIDTKTKGYDSLSYTEGDQINFTNFNGDTISYTAEKSGDNVVLKTSQVRYYLDVTVESAGTVDGKTVSAGHYELELAQRGEIGDATYSGKYLWRMTPSYDSEGHEPYYVYIDLAESDFSVDSETGAVSIVDQAFPSPNTLVMKVNGVMEVIGNAEPVTITKNYYESIKSKNLDARSSLNQGLYEAQKEGVSATLVNYATDDKKGINVYINGDSEHGTNLATQLYDVDMDSTSYDGSWLNEKITGTLGNDTINGGAGDDTIYSGAGDDNITGGAGNDTIYGGAGIDNFHFSGDFGSDTIYDASENDKLFFDGISRSAITYSSENKTFTVGNAQDGNIVTLAESSSGFDKFQAVNEAGIAQEYSLTTKTAFDVPAAGLPSDVTIANADYNGINFLKADFNTENLTFTRTATSTLQVGGITGGTITITDFNFDTPATNMSGLTVAGVGTDTIASHRIAYEISSTYDKANSNTYKEDITVANNTTANISGLDENDTLTLYGAKTRTWNGADNNKLVVTDSTNHKTVTITDYFSNSTKEYYPATGTLDVTLNDTANAYEFTDFVETVHGTGKVAADSIHTAGDNVDRITGEGTFTRTNNGNLFYGNIEVTGFFAEGDHNINVNGALSTNATNIEVTLSDKFVYTATNYAEIFNGNGKITGFSVENDKVYSTSPALARTNNGNLIAGGLELDGITSNFKFTNGTTDTDANTLTVATTLTDALGEATYAALANYKENISLSLTDATSVKVSGLTSDDNLNVGEYSLQAKASETGNLAVVSDGNTINVAVTSFKDIPAFKIANANVVSGAALAVTADADYIASNNYKEIITVTTNGVTVSGLGADDTLNLPSDEKTYHYNSVSGALTVKIGDNVVATVSDYGTNRAFSFGESIANSVLYVTGNNFDAQPPEKTSFAFGSYYIVGDASSKNIYHAGNSEGNNDTIYIGDNNTDIDVVIDGVNYHNYANGWAGSDTIYGGIGNDQIYGQTGNDTIYGGAGDDLINGEVGNDTIYGGTGDDIIRGADGIDTIYGGEGKDTIYGENGNDFLYGEDGDDLINGFADDDYIEGGAGKDTLYGDLGNDEIHGGADNDEIVGHGGNDKLYGDGGSDKIWGSEGDDTIYGGDGDDFLYGEDDTDIIYGGKGNDTIDGGNGADTFVYDFNSGGDDIINNALIVDNITFSETTFADSHLTFTRNADGNLVIGYELENNNSDVANPTGTITLTHFDFAQKTYNLNTINFKDDEKIYIQEQVIDYTLANGETFSASGVYKYALTIPENVTGVSLSGLKSADTLSVTGLTASSTYNRDMSVNSGVGLTIKNDDTTLVTISDYNANHAFSGLSVEGKQLVVTNANNFDAANQGWGFATFNITGTNETDTLTGGEGDDTFATRNGNDNVNGGDGKDIITVDGTGTKTIKGGAGADTFIFQSGSAIITDATSDDKIKFATFEPSQIKFAKGTGENAQDLIISSKEAGDNDTITIKGYFGVDGKPVDGHITTFVFGNNEYTFEWKHSNVENADYMYNVTSNTEKNLVEGIRNWVDGYTTEPVSVTGKSAGDMLAGSIKGDTITAGDGGAELYGDKGNDTLNGGAGNDYIWGGAGENTLTGGAGADTFDFTAREGGVFDTITDATKDDTIAIYGPNFKDMKFERGTGEQANDLIITVVGEGENIGTGDTLTVQDYFLTSEADRVSKFQVGGKEYTLKWKKSNTAKSMGQDVYAMYNIIDNPTAAVEGKVNAVEGIRNWLEGTGELTSGLTITGADKYDMLSGTDYADTITAGANGAELYGAKGDDTLVGGAGADYIAGDEGTNTLTGNGGADKFVLRGSGNDIITDATAEDAILFADNYRADFSGITFAKSGTSLVVTYSEDKTATIENFFTSVDGNEVSANAVTKFQLIHTGGVSETYTLEWKYSNVDRAYHMYNVTHNPNGAAVEGIRNWINGYYNGNVEITGASAGDMLAGSIKDDTITASDGGAELYGDEGNDTLIGGAGADYIRGDEGNDTLTGNGGADVFAIDSGNDVITDATSADVIKFVDDYRNDFTGITFAKGEGEKATSLMVSFGENSSVEIKNYFNVNGTVAENHVNKFAIVTKQAGTKEYTLKWLWGKNGEAMYNFTNDPHKLVDGIQNWIQDAGHGEGIIIEGRDKYDMLSGTDYNDMISAGVNGAEIYATNGNDFIYGNKGDDVLSGGVGDDTIHIEGQWAGGKDVIYIANTTNGARNIGTDTIHGATEDATLKFSIEFSATDIQGYKFSELDFNRVGNHLEIVAGDVATNKVIIDNFFTAHSRVDKIQAINETGAQEYYSILDDAIINVDLDQFEGETYTATDYTELFTATAPALVKGLKKDDIILNGDKTVFTRANGGPLVINDLITVEDFFTTGLNVDFTVNGKSTEDANIAVTLSDGYVYNSTRYDEVISGNGSVKGLDNKKDIIKFSGTPTYTLIEIAGSAGPSANLKITCGNNESITVLDDYLQGNEPVVYAGSTVDNIANQTLNITGLNAFVTSENFKFRDVNITGTDDNDEYKGSAGNDIINGGKGDDTIYGGEGNDTLNGGEGENQIHTGSGNDSVVATTGANTIYVDGYGHKVITSGSKDGNTFVFSKGTAVINGATAKDTIEFATFDPSKVEFVKDGDNLVIKSLVEGDNDTITISEYFKGHTITKFVLGKTETELNLEWKQSNVDGESYLYNVITGTEQGEEIPAIAGIRNWINAAGGDDTVIGADKIDMLAGNDGADVITASNPAEIYGGDGGDEIYALGGDSFVAGGLGDDTITVSGGNNTIALVDTTRSANQKEFGADNVEGAVKGDVLKFSVDYGDTIKSTDGYTFGELSVEKVGVDLIVYAGDDKTNYVVLNDYFTQKEEDRVSAIQALVKDDTTGVYTQVTKDDELTKLVDEYIYAPERTYDEDKIESVKGKIVINKNDQAGEYKINAAEYVSETAKGITVNNKNKLAGLDITGSTFNDTITTKNDVSNTIIENGGNNKITTGNADDVVIAGDYSNNTINVGKGNNTVTLNSTGVNKVTASNGNNDVNVYVGSNTVKLGNGANEIGIAGGVNTVKTGKGANDVFITDGVNKVTTGKGKDEFILAGGNNTISSGVGEDVYNIVDGYNTIKTGNAATTFTISDSYDIKDGDVTVATVTGDGGVNVITSGSRNDIFNIDAGVNTIKSGSGVDTFKLYGGVNNISTGNGNDSITVYDGSNVINAGAGNDTFDIQAGKNTLNGAKGNDTYKVDLTSSGFNFNTGDIVITDTSGKNVLDAIVDTDTTSGKLDILNVFFDVTVKTNKSGTKFKGATYSEMTFTTDVAGADGFDDLDGIDVTSKKAFTTINTSNGATGEDALSHSATISTKQLDKLASDVAGWLFNKGYASTDDVFANEKTDGDIAELVAKYTTFSANDYKM